MKSIFTCLFISVAWLASAQQNTFKIATFPLSYGYLNGIVQLADSSYISAGDAYSGPDSYAYLLKIDNRGTLVTAKTVRDPQSTVIVKTRDGGFAICGNGKNGIDIMKFKADLTLEWQKSYAGQMGVPIDANGITQATDGGFLITGIAVTAGVGGYLLKTDSAGNVQFSKRYLNNDQEYLLSVQGTADGNYVLLGETQHSITDSRPDSAILLKIRADGSLIWSRGLASGGNNQSISPRGFAIAPDDGIVICGDIYTGTSSHFMLMANYDGNGNLLWSKRINVDNHNYSNGGGVVNDKNGGYVFYGSIKPDDTSFSFFVKTDVSGAIQWTKKYPYGQDNGKTYYDLINTLDGGYIGCGIADFLNPGTNGAYQGGFIYKLDGNLTSCNDTVSSEGSMQQAGTSGALNIPTVNVPVTVVSTSFLLSDAGPINSLCSNNVLPLQFLSFTAVLHSKSVSVNWTTANEINSDYFVVERSADKRSFTALQTIIAKGNSNVTQLYSTNDLQPLQGTSYYRLKEVDKDGKVTYSSIASVTVMSSGTVMISPNPVQNNIHVVLQSVASNTVTLQVVDMKGNVLAAQTKAVGIGRNEINIPASSLAKGVYVLKVTGNKTTQAIRFVKE